MSDLIDSVNGVKEIQDGLVTNKVANFAYTDTAYRENDVNGVPVYNENVEQNIPLGTPQVMNVNPTILARGYRASASSLTRMLVNHFLGRMSYNLNKVNDNMKTIIDALKLNLGENVNFASLDATGRIPFSQLPESAVEYKGNWNASTNTTSVSYTSGGVEHNSLMNGWGLKGDFWICNVAGWFKAETGESSSTEVAGYVPFLEGDRIIYDGVTWSKNSSNLINDSLISKLTTWSSNKINDLITALAGRMSTAEGNINSLTGRMGTAEGNINSLAGRVGTLEGKHLYKHLLQITLTTVLGGKFTLYVIWTTIYSNSASAYVSIESFYGEYTEGKIYVDANLQQNYIGLQFVAKGHGSPYLNLIDAYAGVTQAGDVTQYTIDNDYVTQIY